MDQSAIFARHFARLVSLLLHEQASVDEQKMSLRALVIASKSGPVTIAPSDWQLLVNDEPMPGALTGVQDVAAQMTAHALLRVTVGQGSKAADILGLGRIIASQAKAGDAGEQVRAKLSALAAKTIEFETPPPQAPAPPGGSSEAPTVKVAVDAKTAADAMAARLMQDGQSILAQLTGTDVSKLSPDKVLAALDAAKTEEAVTRALD